MKIFADRLCEIQSQRGITRKEMAKQIGIMPTTLSSYMNDAKTPSLDIVAKIAHALGVSVGWLSGEIQESSKMVTYEDYLRNLVALVDTSGIGTRIASDVVPLTMERKQALFKSDEDYFEYCRTSVLALDEKDVSVQIATLEMDNFRVSDFINDWQRIRDLYKSNTIDKEMYDAWLEKRFRTNYANVPLPGRNPEM